MVAKRERKSRPTPPPSDWRESEEAIRMEVFTGVCDTYHGLCETHASTLRRMNQTSAELRRSLELIEIYREQMAGQVLWFSTRLKEGGVTPDGKYRFDDEKGWQRT